MFKIISVTFLLSIIFLGCNRTNQIVGDSGIPPAVPTGLRVYYSSDGEIGIDWNSSPEPDVKGYNIYRRTEFTSAVKVAFVNDNFFFDDSLEYDTVYYYKVTAINLWNRESDSSAEVSAKPQNIYNPQKPVGLQINARNWEGDLSVYIYWLRNDESDIAGYNVYRSYITGLYSGYKLFYWFYQQCQVFLIRPR